MNPILVLSPHLDDAAFSLGPLLAKYSKSTPIIVATAFSKSVYTLSEFALACQLDKGLSVDDDYMDIRKNEDLRWAAAMGVHTFYGELPEAPHRGYDSAAALFGPLLPEIEVRMQLFQWVTSLLRHHEPRALVSPLGIGNHVDHILIKETAERFDAHKVPVYFYRDLPYAGNGKNEIARYHNCSNSKMHEHHVECTDESIAAALSAAGAYETQIVFQFSDVDQMKIELARLWGRDLSLYSLNETSIFC